MSQCQFLLKPMFELLKNTFAIIGVLAILNFLFRIIGITNIVGLYFSLHLSKLPVGFWQLIFMRIRKVDVSTVVKCYMILGLEKIPTRLIDIEAGWLAEADILDITTKVVIAKKHGIDTNFNEILEEVTKKDRLF